jgi:hypothetical protein
MGHDPAPLLKVLGDEGRVWADGGLGRRQPSGTPIVFSKKEFGTALFGKVHGAGFTEPQVRSVLLTDAVTNGSGWAVAFHTTLALKEGIDPADVHAILRVACRRIASSPRFRAWRRR